MGFSVIAYQLLPQQFCVPVIDGLRTRLGHVMLIEVQNTFLLGRDGCFPLLHICGFQRRITRLCLWGFQIIRAPLRTITFQLTVTALDAFPAAHPAAVLPGSRDELMGLLQGAVKFWPVDALPGLLWMSLF